MSNLTPREIVSELDRYIIGQNDAKRMVAIAMRNRWRRQQIDPDLRDEISPKNIILMGPTGVGKTEIARRLAKLTHCPFFKVEATKFTEVGYIGRDVESMIRDLMEIGVSMVHKEETEKVRIKAEKHAEERLLDLLLPRSTPKSSGGPAGFFMGSANGEVEEKPEPPKDDATREKFRQMFRAGQLDDREVELEVTMQSGAQVEIMAIPGMEEMGSNLQNAFSNMFPGKKKPRKMKIKDAYQVLIDEEADKLIDPDAVNELARERVEQQGILFVDEMDKIASRQDAGGGTDVSREGVQRDLLPIVEGSVVNTKYGMVKTDHILFIAAGAFHFAKPSDLIPELQGRFPLREELNSLHKEEFYRILTEPKNALTVQYKALLETEGVSVDFTKEALEEIAETAEKINEETENIGARRLYTILEKILAKLSFEAPDKSGQTITIDREYVRSQLSDVIEDRDLSRYIL